MYSAARGWQWNRLGRRPNHDHDEEQHDPAQHQGEAEHGLGQLAAAKSDYGQAQAHLQRAARLAPTDEKIRNDLGVVYLNQLRIEDARFEFLTAMELKQSDQLAALNLVTLLLYQDDWNRAAELVSRLGLSPAQFSEAQGRAEKLKLPNRSTVAVTAMLK